MGQEIKTVELNDLVGKHKLSGVDFEQSQIKTYESLPLEDCQCVRFCLDGIVYMAIEDPSDGYRSSMGNLIILDEDIKNKFRPVEVIGVMRTPNNNEDGCDVIQFYDAKTNAVVLEIGTENVNDCYPSFVAGWTPENLIHNKPNTRKNKFVSPTTTIQRIIEIPLEEVQTESGKKKASGGNNPCLICGKEIKKGTKHKMVHLLENGNLVSHEGSDIVGSQGLFPVGLDCAK